MLAGFMPLHARWWQERTSTLFTIILFLLWTNQILGLLAFVSKQSENKGMTHRMTNTCNMTNTMNQSSESRCPRWSSQF